MQKLTDAHDWLVSLVIDREDRVCHPSHTLPVLLSWARRMDGCCNTEIRTRHLWMIKGTLFRCATQEPRHYLFLIQSAGLQSAYQ